ncbi:MAG: CPBP family intramembrane metalloprotease [Bacteroides sp.]|nr:CPBP family intramembrane metalloprotease [Bacteroides sp.]
MKKFLEICQFSLVLFGLMICGLFLTGLLSTLPLGSSVGYAGQWVVFAGQNIFAFILPALLTWRICFKSRPLIAIEADRLPSLLTFVIAVVLYFVAIPALNQIIFWNQNVHLPQAFASFENWCREMESLAEQQTSGLLNSTDVFTFVMNLLIIAVLTGIGEEFFFRGALQRMLIHSSVNPHVAIWVSAFIFSALHFQFFGFIPRVLLGAWFGYLYWWCGSIWINSFAHALNNSLVIVSTWFINRGIMSDELDMWGVTEGTFPFWPLASVMAFSILLCLTLRSKVIYKSRMLPPEL